MKMNDKAESLIRELNELLWDNNLILREGSWHWQFLDLKPSSDGASREEEVKRGIDLLHRNINHFATLRWLRQLIAETEELVRINDLKTSFLEEKTSEALEALRSRAMVKALRAGLENEEVFTKIVETNSKKELESAERLIDAKGTSSHELLLPIERS